MEPPKYQNWSQAPFQAEECMVVLPDGTEWPAIFFDSLPDFIAMSKQVCLDDQYTSQLYQFKMQVAKYMMPRQIAQESLRVEIQICVLMGETYPTTTRFHWKVPPESFQRRGKLIDIYFDEYFTIANLSPDQKKLLKAIEATIQLNVADAASSRQRKEEDQDSKPKALEQPAQDPKHHAKPNASEEPTPNASEEPIPNASIQAAPDTNHDAAKTKVTSIQPIQDKSGASIQPTTLDTNNAASAQPTHPTTQENNDVSREEADAPMKDADTPDEDVVMDDDDDEAMEETNPPAKVAHLETPRRKAPVLICNDESPPFDDNTTPKIKTKKKRDDSIETRPSVPVLPDKDIKPLLIMAGYKNSNGGWTRPYGKEIFRSLNDLRHHLCKHGVNCQCKCDREESVACQCWSAEQKGQLLVWVRSSIFTNPMSEYGLIDGATATKLLAKIGFDYSRNGFFTFLGVYEEPMRDGDLFRELAKNGLPPTCNIQAISSEDLFSLECFIAFHYRFTFNYRQERRRSSYSPTALPARRTRMPTSPSTVVTADDVQVNAKKKRPINSSSKGKKKRKSPSVKSPSVHSTPDVEYHVTEAAPPEATTPLAASRLTETFEAQIMPFASMLETKSPEPVFHGCDVDKLRSASAALSLSNRFDSPSFQSDRPSRFTESLNTVYKFLQGSVQSRTREISPVESISNSLYVCGVPGIGKTSGVHWCCDRFMEVSKGKMKPQLTLCKINASSLITGNSDPIVELVREVRVAMGMPNNTSFRKIRNRITQSVSGGLAKSYLVLVVDEIDAMMTSKKRKEAFTNLIELSNDPRCQFALIGISNSMSDEKYDQMQVHNTFGQSVTFSAYSEKELIHILQARVGSTIVDHPALQFVAKKVSRGSGDARSALDMLVTAIQRRLETTTDETSSNGPLITMRDVHMVSNGDKENSVKSIIEGQSTAMKSLLCILVSLSQAGVVESTFGNLRSMVTECLQRSGQSNELLDNDDFSLSLEMLADQGLIRLVHKSPSVITHGFLVGLSISDRAKQPICLGTQLDEVQQVLESELKQSFYQTIQDNARRKGNKECGKK